LKSKKCNKKHNTITSLWDKIRQKWLTKRKEKKKEKLMSEEINSLWRI
jgi:hypothetical protein